MLSGSCTDLKYCPSITAIFHGPCALLSPKSWPLQVEMWLWDPMKSFNRESDSNEVRWTLVAVPSLSGCLTLWDPVNCTAQAPLSFTLSLRLQYCCSCLLWTCHPKCYLSIWKSCAGIPRDYNKGSEARDILPEYWLTLTCMTEFCLELVFLTTYF